MGGLSLSFFRQPRPDVERERNDQDNDDDDNKSDRQLRGLYDLPHSVFVSKFSFNSTLLGPGKTRNLGHAAEFT